jgi:hypothetical protein
METHEFYPYTVQKAKVGYGLLKEKISAILEIINGKVSNEQLNNAIANGSVATAAKLATARTIALTGAVAGSGTFDGSGNLSIATAASQALVVNTMRGRNASQVLIPGWNYNDGQNHILEMMWSPNGYSGTTYYAKYTVRMWSGGNTTSWNIWAAKVAGNNNLAFSNGGAGILKVVPTDGTTSGFDYVIWWS